MPAKRPRKTTKQEQRQVPAPAVPMPRAPVGVDDPDRPGLRCPGCHCGHLPVSYTRHRGKRIMRVRHCRNCGRKVVSFEALAGAGS